ncbi:hypothetical protein [Umezawaea tangerina]|uniref:Uncharacterized protein n=1 Tax=Umezawaea tangerina TaxID=84725 RepID=A0A2T0T2L1_9PSEU|nr:hypothetical protein [Umezawaea tangerina]PRY39881.1 hypothetical protein CLV43_107468 [Umezawaea tangerina]
MTATLADECALPPRSRVRGTTATGSEVVRRPVDRLRVDLAGPAIPSARSAVDLGPPRRPAPPVVMP